jgi:hypothetical protein
LWYRIECDSFWRLQSVELGEEGAAAQISLRAAGESWTAGDGRRLPGLDGCIDVDISLTPFTNTLPIRRLNLKPANTQMLEVAYIDGEEMKVRSAWQRYTCLRASARGGLYRYESMASGFTRDLEVDADRLVLDYPEIWRRIPCD